MASIWDGVRANSLQSWGGRGSASLVKISFRLWHWTIRFSAEARARATARSVLVASRVKPLRFAPRLRLGKYEERAIFTP